MQRKCTKIFIYTHVKPLSLKKTNKRFLCVDVVTKKKKQTKTER